MELNKKGKWRCFPPREERRHTRSLSEQMATTPGGGRKPIIEELVREEVIRRWMDDDGAMRASTHMGSTAQPHSVPTPAPNYSDGLSLSSSTDYYSYLQHRQAYSHLLHRDMHASNLLQQAADTDISRITLQQAAVAERVGRPTIDDYTALMDVARARVHARAQALLSQSVEPSNSTHLVDLVEAMSPAQAAPPQAQPQAYLSRDALKEALKSRITEKIREKLKTLNQPQIQENESQGAASRNILFASKREGSAAGKAFLNDSYVAAARRYSNSKRKSIEQIEQQRVAIDLTTDSPTPPPVKTRKVAETTGRQQQQKAENLDKIIGSLRDENFRSAIQEDKDYLQNKRSEIQQFYREYIEDNLESRLDMYTKLESLAEEIASCKSKSSRSGNDNNHIYGAIDMIHLSLRSYRMLEDTSDRLISSMLKKKEK